MAYLTDFLKQYDFSKFRKIFAKLVEWTVYAVLILTLTGVGAGVLMWNLYQPKLQELGEKDPDRFQEMKEDFKRLKWGQAWKLYRTLDRMTMNEVYHLRYSKWKTQWQQDNGFRDKQLEARAETHDETHKERLQQYTTQTRSLEALKRRSESGLQTAWNNATPWQKGLMLREACVRYLEQEEQDFQRRKNIRQPSPRGGFLAGHRQIGLSASEHCDRMVRVDHQPATVDRSLMRLMAGMNYYYFSRLIAELGLPRETLFPADERVVKMTDDFETF